MEQALIISKKLHTRAQLRQLFAHIEELESPVAINSLGEGRELLRQGRRFRFMFIGSEFTSEECSAFIDVARRCETPSDKFVFVLVFTGGDQNPESVAMRMMGGFHGFLCEPWSLESVMELAQLAEKVSQQRTIFRLKAATGILMSDIKDEPDASSVDPNRLWNQAQESCINYSARTNESVTMALMSVLKSDGDERVRAARSMRDRMKNMSGMFGRYVRQVLPRSRRRIDGS